MTPPETQERHELESRIRAVGDLVATKLGLTPTGTVTRPTGDTSSREDVQTRLVRPFRAWWDFDTPWRNKK